MIPLPPSPLPIEGPASQCVELIIYDNDGPEGYYERMRFERSADAILMIGRHFSEDEIKSFNFELINHWK